MAINLTYSSGNAVTVSTLEMSLAVTGGSTTLQTLTDVGIYTLVLDAAAMLKADDFAWKVYEKAHTSATKRVIMQGRLSDAQSELFTIPNLMLGLGWDITLIRVAGVDRAFAWSVRRVS